MLGYEVQTKIGEEKPVVENSGVPRCPKCGGTGKYIKGWDMKGRIQAKGKPRGIKSTRRTPVTRIKLYRCNGCMRLFRKGEKVDVQKET